MYLHTLLRNNSDGLKEFSTEIEIVNCESKWKWDKHNKLFQKMLSYLNNTVIKACKIRDFITHFTCYTAVFQYFFWIILTIFVFQNFPLDKQAFWVGQCPCLPAVTSTEQRIMKIKLNIWKK